MGFLEILFAGWSSFCECVIYEPRTKASTSTVYTECKGEYKSVSIKPHPNKALGFAEASIETKYGKIRSYWYYKDGAVYYEVDVPRDITATVVLPSGYTERVSGGTFHFSEMG